MMADRLSISLAQGQATFTYKAHSQTHRLEHRKLIRQMVGYFRFTSRNADELMQQQQPSERTSEIESMVMHKQSCICHRSNGKGGKTEICERKNEFLILKALAGRRLGGVEL